MGWGRKKNDGLDGLGYESMTWSKKKLIEKFPVQISSITKDTINSALYPPSAI
jgi:hypothetical protein